MEISQIAQENGCPILSWANIHFNNRCETRPNKIYVPFLQLGLKEPMLITKQYKLVQM